MRYEEVRNYIRANQTCPELTHADGASASHHNGFIELLDAAYATYLNAGLVKGQKDFSTLVCGKAPSYLSCMRARGRTPSQLVLSHILNDARLLRDGILANKHYGSPHTPTLNNTCGALEALINTMEQMLANPKYAYADR